MPESPPFHELERALKRSGVIPDVIERTIVELGDHYLDLIDEAKRAGLDSISAESYASRQLGDEAEIAGIVRNHQELLHWSFRHPLAAACGRSVCCVFALPLVPVVYCAQRRETLARWGVSFGLASLLTASLFLALYSLFPY